MTSWRMSFREGKGGNSLWELCQEKGIALLEYGPVDGVDLASFDTANRPPKWHLLASSQKSALDRFAYEMSEKDVIYVKDGTWIVGKGTVASGYRFDRDKRFLDSNDYPWEHYRRMRWEEFEPIEVQIGANQQPTLVPLSEEDISLLEWHSPSDGSVPRMANIADIEGLRKEAISFRLTRSPKLRKAALDDSKGICAVCNRDYSRLLAGSGIRALQVHHIELLASRKTASRTRLSDLVVVCANCHLFLHLDVKKPMKVEKLKRMLQDSDYIARVK